MMNIEKLNIEKLNIEKPIVFLDLETTGINLTNDRIIEICMIKENLNGTREEFYSRINPESIRISKEASEVHGITNEDLLNEPKFCEIADKIIEFINGCAIGGYNIIQFDLPILSEEFGRCGKSYNFKKHQIFDSYLIWTKSETRTLTDAVKRYLEENHTHAHQAKADVEAAAKILKKQLKEYSFLYSSIDDLLNKTTGLKNSLDLSSKFVRNDEGSVILTVGKHKNKTINQILAEDANYFKWMYEMSDFPSDTKLIAKQIYEKFTITNKISHSSR